MDKYDASEFRKNPSRFSLFTSARIACHIFTHNGEHDLEEGTQVSIEYVGTERNRLYRRDEPSYRIKGTQQIVSGSLLADFSI